MHVTHAHATVAKSSGAELLPEVQFALAPGKPHGAGDAVEVLADRREVAALAYFIGQKRQHALRQRRRSSEQVVESRDGAQGVKMPRQGSEQHALLTLIIQVD